MDDRETKQIIYMFRSDTSLCMYLKGIEGLNVNYDGSLIQMSFTCGEVHWSKQRQLKGIFIFVTYVLFSTQV